MGEPLPPREPQMKEWLCWRQVCKHLERRGITPNAGEHVGLLSAIRLWGEELVVLREADPKHTQKALEEKRQEYEPHVIDDWES